MAEQEVLMTKAVLGENSLMAVHVNTKTNIVRLDCTTVLESSKYISSKGQTGFLL